MTDPRSREALLERLLQAAKRAGADQAEALLVSGRALGVQIRQGRREELERSEQDDLGLRVFVGRRNAVVSTTALDAAGFDRLAAQAVAMARVVPDDEYADLCDRAHRGRLDGTGLDLADDSEPDAEALFARAGAAEAAALAVHGVTNSGGGSASFGRTVVSLATSAGFLGSYLRSSHSVSCSVLAGEGTGMQRDYDYHSASHLAALDDPEAIGRSAGERAVARLAPNRPRTGTMPVVYDRRVSGSILGHLASAVNGAAIARGTSFLKERMGERILPAGYAVTDDPRRPRGSRSRPFDGEGVPTAPLHLVSDGVLRSWVLDGRSARQLGLATTGNASRGPSSPPSPGTGNLFLTGGEGSVNDLIGDIAEGVYVNELMGNAVNGLTGDYSRGGAGFMIRNGALAEPVAEFTIAGNLVPMLAGLRAAGDLEFRRGTDAPTLRIDGLMVAGS